jgi:hypothetical protein
LRERPHANSAVSANRSENGATGHPRKLAAGHPETAIRLYFAVRAGPVRPSISLYFRGQRVARILPVF